VSPGPTAARLRSRAWASVLAQANPGALRGGALQRAQHVNNRRHYERRKRVALQPQPLRSGHGADVAISTSAPARQTQTMARPAEPSRACSGSASAPPGSPLAVSRK
jgi:hypothetical protein